MTSLTPYAEAPPPLSHSAPPLSVRWYLGLLSSHPFLVAQSALASGLIQLFSLGMPLFYLIIFDRVFGRQNLATLDVMAVGLLGILAADWLTKALRKSLLTQILARLDQAALDDILARLSRSTATLRPLDLLQAAWQGTSALTQAICSASFEAVCVLLTATVLFLLNPLLAAVSLAPIVLLGILFLLETPGQLHKTTAMQKHLQLLQAQWGEWLRIKPLLQAQHMLQPWQNRLHGLTSQWLIQHQAARSLRVDGGAAQSLIMNLGMLATLYVGAHLVLDRQISFGVYIAVNLISKSVISTLSRVIQAWVQVYLAQAGSQTLQAALAQAESAQHSADANGMHTGRRLEPSVIHGQLSVNGLIYSYPTEGEVNAPPVPPVLKQVTFRIAPGETVVLAGPSGGGKSTLCQLLEGIESPLAGSILMDNIPLNALSSRAQQQAIGVLPQHVMLIAGSLRDNLTLGRDLTKGGVPSDVLMEALSIAHVDEFLMHLPRGLETPVFAQGTNLSASQAARIGLARLLIQNPKILVLDNALASIEKPLQNSILHQLIHRKGAHSLLIVTDQPAVHQQASRILVLHQGRIVETGTFTELMAHRGLYAHLYSDIPVTPRVSVPAQTASMPGQNRPLSSGIPSGMLSS